MSFFFERDLKNSGCYLCGCFSNPYVFLSTTDNFWNVQIFTKPSAKCQVSILILI